MQQAQVRQSNYELLRIFSMFMIIFYHLIFFIVARNHRDVPFWPYHSRGSRQLSSAGWTASS